MDIRILTPKEQTLYYDEIYEMLVMSDDEFVPPLSARSSTTQKDLTSCTRSEDGILLYFEELKKQRIMVAAEDGVLFAFVSFRENFSNAQIPEMLLPNIYLSTLIARPQARGRGLTKSMYSLLFETFRDRNICTRTWSTNIAHISILSKFGFETLCTLPDDRGPGIDTVYFVKKSA